ncbi:protein of unknown function [Aminobacter niigataensis]|nr:protein of unknown function [Aminobacter niigataensis]
MMPERQATTRTVRRSCMGPDVNPSRQAFHLQGLRCTSDKLFHAKRLMRPLSIRKIPFVPPCRAKSV